MVVVQSELVFAIAVVIGHFVQILIDFQASSVGEAIQVEGLSVQRVLIIGQFCEIHMRAEQQIAFRIEFHGFGEFEV
jgi:hypothetical protein